MSRIVENQHEYCIIFEMTFLGKKVWLISNKNMICLQWRNNHESHFFWSVDFWFLKTFVLMILTPLKKSFWSCTFKFFIYSKRFYKKSHQKCLFAWKLQIQILFSEFHQRFGTHELILTRNVSRLAISLSILKIKIRVRKLPRGKVMLSAEFSSGS